MTTSGGPSPIVDIAGGHPNPQLAAVYSQTAPYPQALADLVAALTYRPGWVVELRTLNRDQGCSGLTLCVLATVPDSYAPEKTIRVMHYLPVPAAAYNERSWRRWLFDQLLLVERHEAAEFFTIGGVKPYAPLHGPGNDPYIVAELATDEERRTSYRGEVT